MYPMLPGCKNTPNPLFVLPFRNHWELRKAFWWLFFKMAGLYDGAKGTNLALTRISMWRLETGSTKENKWKWHSIVASCVSSVLHQIETKFRRLPYIFEVALTYEAIVEPKYCQIQSELINP